MWQYFGTKLNKAKFYPTPIYDTIIEPFAGAAGYSLRHWRKRVILVDRDEKIIRVWRWLQKSHAEDIYKLPWGLKEGDDLRDQKYDCIEAMWFISFLIMTGAHVQNKISSFGKNYNTNKRRIKRTIANLEQIRNWTFIHGDYHALENIKATWFIDPPYQYGGESYTHGNKKIDYRELAEWCKSRNGQIIVCENTAANWMNFQPMTIISKNHYHKTTEAIWSNLPTFYDYQQLTFL